jgi:hypothetical protein
MLGVVGYGWDGEERRTMNPQITQITQIDR